MPTVHGTAGVHLYGMDDRSGHAKYAPAEGPTSSVEKDPSMHGCIVLPAVPGRTRCACKLQIGKQLAITSRYELATERRGESLA